MLDVILFAYRSSSHTGTPLCAGTEASVSFSQITVMVPISLVYFFYKNMSDGFNSSTLAVLGRRS
jgi:hypothetical protein